MQQKIIYGPPGTGKTTRLIELLEAELERGVRPDRIAFVSFTKEGSENGRSRAMKAFKLKEDDFPYFRTLHSLAFRACGMKRDSVMSKYHYSQFSKKLGMHFTGYYTEDLRNDDDLFLFYDELCRNTPKAASYYDGLVDTETLKYVQGNYRAYKDTFHLFDFTDMISEFVNRGLAAPVDVAFIDEAQDLTSLQWTMAWCAFRDCERIYIAGDDDQAIYQWSGADVEQFLSLSGEREILRHSHRVPKRIKAFSERISKQIVHRVEKEYEDTGREGILTYANSLDEFRIKEDETYMFLSRNSWYLTEVKTWLEDQGIPYAYKRKPVIKSSDVEAVNSYEKARTRGKVSADEKQKLFPYLKEGYSIKNPWYDSFNFDPEYAMFLRNVIKRKPKSLTPLVNVSTIHSVKGAEADNVILLLDMTRQTYQNLQRNPDSEHRVFYVGATRAKNALHVVYSSGRYEYPVEGGEA
ncbi:MAG: UvrD-helicase domain-containing protein [Patescibacteria group bacterium]